MTASTLLFRLLLALVVLAPVPFAAQRPWAWSLMGVTIGLLLLLWGALVLTGRARAAMPMSRLWFPAVPFLLVLCWAVLQTTGLVPAGWQHPLWGEAARALNAMNGSMVGSISLDPSMTVTAVLRLATYGGVFWLAVQLGRERARAREALVTLATAGIAYAVYGLAVRFGGWEYILWYPKWAYHGDVTATFVNRNAYGAYAGIGLLCCVALFVHGLRPTGTGDRRAFDLAEALLVRALPYLAGGLVIGTALLLSHSRGAFLATGVSLLVLIVALVKGRILRPGAAFPAVVALLVVGLSSVIISGDGTVDRLWRMNIDQEGRPDLMRQTLVAIGDAPWTGYGLGAFLPAFRLYRDSTLADTVVYDFAHNVHLELAMDLGLPGALVFYAAIIAVAAVCAAGLVRRRRDQIHPAVALAAMTLLGLHGLVDFSAQMPAIGATLALLLGIGYAQSWNTAEHGRSADW
ncbi:O-antigen ligase family protein [Azospirillum oleiclasticum]|nr:O-antigen ligase family protein [Azospirillum oleiclasticum]